MKKTNQQVPNQQSVDDGNIALIKTLRFFGPVSNDIAAYFKQHTYAIFISKGGILLNTGAVCNNLYFIKKGAIRGFIKEGRKEITTYMTAENELVTSISSFDLQIPAIENIEAIEDCQLLVISYAAVQNLYEQFPEFNFIGRKILQQYYRDSELRAFIARLTNADSKYNYFLQIHSHLANRVPLKYIASYLGITIETLSRVRKKLSSAKAK